MSGIFKCSNTLSLNYFSTSRVQFNSISSQKRPQYQSSALYLVLVGALWGCTNPLIKKGSSGVQHVKSSNRVHQFFKELYFLVTNWKYMIPFLLNQFGSVLYFLTLQEADLSVAVPVTNSLTFVFTALAGTLLGERKPSIGTLLGMILVLSGITLCVLDKTAYTL